MKAVISNRIYLDGLNFEEKESIRKELTYLFKSAANPSASYAQVEKVVNYKSIGNVLSIPQVRTDLIPEYYSVIDKRITVPAEIHIPNIQLYDNQIEIYDKVQDNGILLCKPGWGKTFTALWLAYKFQCKTLVISPNTFIRDMWLAEIEKLFDFPAGRVQTQFREMDSPIIATNIQAIRKMGDDLSKEFGLIIVDECHRTVADSYTNFLNKSYARYKIGLTGTLERKDSKHTLTQDYFGKVVHKAAEANTMAPEVHIIKTDWRLAQGKDWVKRINELAYNQEYLEFIASVAAAYIYQGHKVLIISERVEFSERMAAILPKCEAITGSIGDRKQISEDMLAGKLNAIVATRSIFSEGISINNLSTLVLAFPSSNDPNLEQLCGRVQRTFTGKDKAIVVDIHFASNAEQRQALGRLEVYKRKGWEIKVV